MIMDATMLLFQYSKGVTLHLQASSTGHSYRTHWWDVHSQNTQVINVSRMNI